MGRELSICSFTLRKYKDNHGNILVKVYDFDGLVDERHCPRGRHRTGVGRRPGRGCPATHRGRGLLLVGHCRQQRQRGGRPFLLLCPVKAYLHPGPLAALHPRHVAHTGWQAVCHPFYSRMKVVAGQVLSRFKTGPPEVQDRLSEGTRQALLWFKTGSPAVQLTPFWSFCLQAKSLALVAKSLCAFKQKTLCL